MATYSHAGGVTSRGLYRQTNLLTTELSIEYYRPSSASSLLFLYTIDDDDDNDDEQERMSAMHLYLLSSLW